MGTSSNTHSYGTKKFLKALKEVLCSFNVDIRFYNLYSAEIEVNIHSQTRIRKRSSLEHRNADSVKK